MPHQFKAIHHALTPREGWAKATEVETVTIESDKVTRETTALDKTLELTGEGVDENGHAYQDFRIVPKAPY